MSGHVIETQLVRTCKRPYSSRFAENHGSVVDERHTFCLSFSLKFHATDCVILICTPNVHETWRFYSVVRIPTSSDEIPWYVKFPVFSLARDSMVRVISHTQKPGNSTVHEITDVEIVAKLPDTRKLQHVYCTKFDHTFNFHDIEKSDTAFLLHWYLTICFLVSIALHCISGTYLWGCSIILKMIFNSSDHSTIFITAPVLFTLTNCPTHEGKTQVLNRVTSFILKFKYRNKVW